MPLRLFVIVFWYDELITLAVNVYNLDVRVLTQVLTQLCDIHIHRTGIEVVVVNPDGLQGEVTLQNLVRVRAEQ